MVQALINNIGLRENNGMMEASRILSKTSRTYQMITRSTEK